MTRILVVEDDWAILHGLKDNLEQDSHEVLTATDGEAGHALIQSEKPDLVILDLMLPKLSGYEICRKVRSDGLSVPIIMLTARGEEADRVLGLDLGADDYITKPFSIRELLARVRALLRRSEPKPAQLEELQFGDVVLDFQRFEASKGDDKLTMTRKEFGVIQYLASRDGKVVSRAELLAEVWGHDHYPTTRTVDNHVASLRSKLEDNPSTPIHLLTVRGIVYRFVL